MGTHSATSSDTASSAPNTKEKPSAWSPRDLGIVLTELQTILEEAIAWPSLGHVGLEVSVCGLLTQLLLARGAFVKALQLAKSALIIAQQIEDPEATCNFQALVQAIRRGMDGVT